MTLALLGMVCCGVFAGAAFYISLVEHPARMSCGTQVAVTEFAPSYKRAAVMQASLAVAGFVLSVAGGWATADPWLLVAALLLGAVVPFTLIVIAPINRRLLDPSIDKASPEAANLLDRWARLHAVRTALSLAAFLLMAWRVGGA